MHAGSDKTVTGAEKVRLLIVSTEMHVGGVTTALLALLNLLPPTRYTVDLLLYEQNGPLQDQIPSWVHLLPEAKTDMPTWRKLCSPAYDGLRARALLKEKLLHHPMQGLQLRARAGARFSRRLNDVYDLAISFIEFWPLYYTARYVQARHKLAWVHVDYAGSDLSVRLDQPVFSRYDRLVMVSGECADNFRRLCPRHASRCIYLPNLCSSQALRERARRASAPLPQPEPFRVKLISVCRISFLHKGIDRGLAAFGRLHARGKLRGVAWYIVGDGPDFNEMVRQVSVLGLERQVFCLGRSLEPLPLVAQCDAFFLPSRYEGKPLAVTEAMILGLPALVTHYASAEEQIQNGTDGLIVENSEEAIEQGLEELCETPGLLARLTQNVRERSYGNEADLEQYERLFAQLGVLNSPSM